MIKNTTWGGFQPLIFVLQALGFFPYGRDTAAHKYPAFSPELGLWSVIIWCVLVVQSCLSLSELAEGCPEGTRLGDMILTIIRSSHFVGTIASVFWSACQSRHLVALVHGLEAASEGVCRGKMKSALHIMPRNVFCILAFIETIYLISSKPVVAIIQDFKVSSVLLSVCVAIIMTASTAIVLVFIVSLKKLSCYLECVVEDLEDAMERDQKYQSSEFAVKTILPASVIPERHGNVWKRLSSTGEHIDKIEELQGFLASYISGFLLCTFLGTIIIDITCLYSILSRGPEWRDIVDVATIVVAYVSICHSAQNYADHIGKVHLKIRRIVGKNPDPIVQSKMTVILMTLDRMRTFDVSGYFTLGHHTLVEVASFTATYLVVLLQVVGH